MKYRIRTERDEHGTVAHYPQWSKGHWWNRWHYYDWWTYPYDEPFGVRHVKCFLDYDDAVGYIKRHPRFTKRVTRKEVEL